MRRLRQRKRYVYPRRRTSLENFQLIMLTLFFASLPVVKEIVKEGEEKEEGKSLSVHDRVEEHSRRKATIEASNDGCLMMDAFCRGKSQLRNCNCNFICLNSNWRKYLTFVLVNY